MRQIHFTLGLGAMAVTAVWLAPRLQAMIRKPACENPAVMVQIAAPIPQTTALLAVPLPPEPAVVAEVRAVPTVPLLPLPARPANVIPIKTGGAGGSVIAEVSAKIPVGPPELPPPGTFWDDCPACGMG